MRSATNLPSQIAAKVDAFDGPFVLWNQSVAANGPLSPGPQGAAFRRLRALGRWAKKSRWYVDGLLQPMPGAFTDHEPGGVVISRLRTWQLEKPIRFAYLDRTLGEIVADGPQYLLPSTYENI